MEGSKYSGYVLLLVMNVLTIFRQSTNKSLPRTSPALHTYLPPNLPFSLSTNLQFLCRDHSRATFWASGVMRGIENISPPILSPASTLIEKLWLWNLIFCSAGRDHHPVIEFRPENDWSYFSFCSRRYLAEGPAYQVIRTMTRKRGVIHISKGATTFRKRAREERIPVSYRDSGRSPHMHLLIDSGFLVCELRGRLSHVVGVILPTFPCCCSGSRNFEHVAPKRTASCTCWERNEPAPPLLKCRGWFSFRALFEFLRMERPRDTKN